MNDRHNRGLPLKNGRQMKKVEKFLPSGESDPKSQGQQSSSFESESGSSSAHESGESE